MMKKITITLIGILIIAIVIALTGGCIREIEEKPSEGTIYTYTAQETKLEKETQEQASIVWGKIKDFDEAKFVTSEKSYSSIVFIHPYTVGAFDPSTAEWVVVVSSIPEKTRETKISIFRLDYQTFDLKKAYKFSYPLGEELTLDDAVTIMEEEMTRELYPSKVDREKVVLLGGNYVYSYPASDFRGTIIVNKYAGKAIFYATTVWDGTGRLIIPAEVEITPPPPHPWAMMFESVFLWENGKEQFVAGENSPMSKFLRQILHRLNLQAKCVFTEENIQEIKENDKVIEMRFRFPEHITISQWIKPQDRDRIKTDENGYRILENVKNALFILEDNPNEGLEAHILVGSGAEFWSCWAIRQEGSDELDKTWIDEINKILGGAS
jgi:hypothetical protein